MVEENELPVAITKFKVKLAITDIAEEEQKPGSRVATRF